MWTRRGFLASALAAAGLPAGAKLEPAAAGGGLAWTQDRSALNPLRPRAPMFPAKAKSVIFLVHQGALSQVDSFDRKPDLDRHHGKKLSEEILKGVGKVMTYFGGNSAPLMRSPYKFAKRGECGKEVSELFPNLGGCVDDMCFLHSIYNDINNHAPAMFQLNSGTIRQGYPSMGAWVTYGLGSENPDLPGFIVMTEKNSLTLGGPANWGSGFLPAAYQGTLLRSGATPILDLNSPVDLPPPARDGELDLLRKLNREHLLPRADDTELEARMAAYDLAFRMQARVPEIVDLSNESSETQKLYGLDSKETEDLGRKCLLARRLVERGVRFVQIDHGGWDHHGGGDQNLLTDLPQRCLETDLGASALVKDLKHRGMLDDTLVIWGSEFGRQPMAQNKPSREDAGRDHLRSAFTVWLAGGGIKRGAVLGATDDFGLSVVEEPVHVHDLQATILHCLGIDHTRLTYRFQGRDFRLTDVEGRLVEGMLA
jgi:hypothetical protein